MAEANHGAGASPSRVDAARYVLAVKEYQRGSTDISALAARFQLARALRDARMHSEAAEVLVEAVMDASRLFGSDDERTLQARLLLGDAHLAAGDPLMALCVCLTLLEDATALGYDGLPLGDAVREATRRSATEADVD
jgi:hypothetical protein